jgi:V/A-type H+-transporting ATPase subunit C
LPSTSYAFATAYLKGEEARLITSEHVERMLSAANVQGILEIIKDTDIGSYLIEVNPISFEDIDQSLWVYLGRCLELLEGFRMLPAELLKILSAYRVKYDILNVKAALWGVTTGRRARMIPVGALQSCGLLDRLANAENLDDIIESLARCNLGNYADILREHEEQLNEGTRSRLQVDARLDNEYYRNMRVVAREGGDAPVFSKALGIIIDLTNLQIISRAIIEGIGPEAANYAIGGGTMLSSAIITELLSLKLSDVLEKLDDIQYRDVAEEILSGYDSTKNIAVVAEIIDGHKFRLIKEILAPRVLSPIMMLYYLILKEAEIRNLRLILKAMFDGIPLGETKNYLVLAS